MKRAQIIILLVICLGETMFAQLDSTKTMPYKVRAEIREVKNRILECNVRNHTVLVDQPRAFGADDTAPTPPEMLAVAYGSCIASSIQFLASQRKLEVSDISVIVEGSVDFARAMGMNDKTRAGFPSLHARISFKAPMSNREKQELVEDVLRVGAVIDNVRNNTSIDYEIVD